MLRQRSSLTLLIGAFVAAAALQCSGSNTGVDGGTVDAGSSDAGRDAGQDAGNASVDAGLDAGGQDAGTVDAGSTDAGSPDAGPDGGCATINAGSAVLLGDPCIAPTLDGIGQDAAEAFAFTAPDAGTSAIAYVYVGPVEPPGLMIQLGVYADDGSGAPGGLIESAWITAPVAGAWNSVSFPFTTTTQGTQYWLAIHPVSSDLDGLGMYDSYDIPGATQSHYATQTGSLPSTWPLASSTPENRGPVSAYITN